ncbi:MAG: TonB-dependent receptor [Flavobacteriales bacterium]|nr:TonB-dependent receptor [Flavobacteriales bacterium]MBL6876668.1 TonB-dependent receptor [Flavobacteriales bacterium]
MNKFYLFILLTFTSYTFSQEYTAEQRANFANLLFTVSGSVTDSETNVPLEYATISLKHKRLPDKIFGGITDENGKFSVEVNPGMYNIKIDYISFESYVDDNLRVIENTDIGNIALNLDVSMLDEVEVRAERTQVEIRLDKKIYNVGQDITVRGGNVSDVLANIPSIDVDFDGNISLRGNNNVTILINGKPSGLVGLSGPQGLRSIPSESIEKVEVVTSPSARYSAEGTAGILNIILKKQDLLGFNGNVDLNIGEPKNTGASGTFNLRNNKINFFSTTSIKDSDNSGSFIGNTEYFNSNLKIDNNTNSNRNRKNTFLNLGVEYYFDDDTSLSLSGFYRKGDELSYSKNIVNDITNIDIVSSNERVANDEELEESFEYSLDFYKDFDEDGHTLSAKVSYEENDENSIDKIEDYSTIPFVSESSFERTTNIDFQNRFLAQVDYVYPIDENTEFEFGYRGRFLDRETDFDVSFLRGGTYQSDPGLSNIFKYNESINSFYTQFGKKINSVSVLLGLRYEASKQEIDQRTTNQFEVKKYSDLFPTVNLAYEISDVESLTLGYSKRVRRPRGWDINPFPRRNSITSYRRGNPFLDPTFTSAYEVDYLKRFKKITINTAIFYRQSDGNVERIQQETGELVDLIVDNGTNNPVLQVPVLEYYPINLSTNKRFGSELSITYTPSRSVRINGSFTLNSSKIRGDYLGQSFDSDDTNWSARFNGFIRLPKNYSLQFFGFLRGPSENAFSKSKAFGFTTAAIQKSIFNKKGNISLRYSDLFNTGKWRSITTRESFRSESEGQWREPSLILTLSYRISEDKSKRKQRARNNQQEFNEGGGDEGPIFN